LFEELLKEHLITKEKLDEILNSLKGMEVKVDENLFQEYVSKIKI
jgi:hypothetical protein